MKKTAFLISLVMLMITNISYTLTEDEDFNFYLLMGKKYFSEGKYIDCIEILEKVIKKYPDDAMVVNAMSSIASAEIQLNEFDKAKNYISVLQREYPDFKDKGIWSYQLALIAFNQGESRTAIKKFEYYIDNYPDDEYIPKSLYLLYTLYNKVGDSEMADKINAKLITKFPDNELTERIELKDAFLYYKKHKYDKAAEKYKEFIKNHEKSKLLAEAYFFLGSCYSPRFGKYRNSKTEQAIKNFQKVIIDFPESTWVSHAEYEIGHIYFNLDEYDKAIAQFETYLAKYKGDKYADKVMYWLAAAYQSKGNFEEAKDTYTKLIEKYPQSQWAKRAEKELKDSKFDLRSETIKSSTELTAPKKEVRFAEITIKSGIELSWKAKPTFSINSKDLKDISSVEVIFYIKHAFAEWNIGNEGYGDLDYDIKWHKGPGPFIITVDKNTGKPSQEEIIGEATVIIKKKNGNENGETSKSIFNYNEYIKDIASHY